MVGLLVIGLMTISVRADGPISENGDEGSIKNNGLYHGVPLDQLWIDQEMDGRNSCRIKAGGSNPIGIDPIGAEKFSGLSRVVSDSVIRSWIRQDTTIPFLSGTVPAAMTVDSAGNVYIVGTCANPGNKDDIVIIKYNLNGERLWIALYDGPDHESEVAQCIASDSHGNVYASGHIGSSASVADYVVIKYDSLGNQLWNAIYNGTGDYYDDPRALVVDDSGNVYVTGCSYGSGTSYDYVTLKYDMSGNQVWVSRYNGSSNSDDIPSAIALDRNGNVYVTGRAINTGTGEDYTTIKYSSAGEQLWIATYDGPKNSNDQASAIKIDSDGSIYITGGSEGFLTGMDYATIKYDSSGNQVWVARYGDVQSMQDLAEAIDVDYSGNVYVTGYSHNLAAGIDFLTIKYDSAGQQLWNAIYSGSAGGANYPSGMVVDSAGDVIVSGRSQGDDHKYDYATIKYDTNGNQLWESRYDGSSGGNYRAVAVKSIANQGVWVTGFGLGDNARNQGVIIKYDQVGNQLWESKVTGAGYRSTYYCSMQLTPAGHVAVAAASYGKGGGTNCMTQLYDSKGKKLWQAWYDGPTHSHDHPTDLVVDRDGNVCITGMSHGTNNNDCITIKYSPSGEELWAARYNGPADSSDQASAITVDSAGQFYVAGYSYHPDSHYDMLTVKYSSSGQELWSAGYNGAGDSSDYGRGIAVDPSGAVYVAAESWGSDGNSDLAVVKYTPVGEMAWEKRYSIASNTSEKPIDLKLDSEGNPYVAGYSLDNRYFALKLNPDGEIVWSVVPEFSGILSGMTLDPSGQLYLTGSAYINSDHGDYAVVKLDSNGQILWQRFSDWRGNAVFVTLYAVTLDNHGDVYLSGKMHWPNLSFESDLLTVKYSAAGELIWVKTTDVSGDNNAYARSIVVDQDYNVYCAGWVSYEDLPLCLFVQKYRQIMTDVGESILPSGVVFSLDPAYPNPFNPTTVISFNLPVASPVSLKIYDMLGREAATLVSGELSAGTHAVRWQADDHPAGVYLCRLQAGAWTQTCKITLLK